MSVEHVQRKSGTVRRLPWHENGQPHQLGMFPSIASDERLRNAICHETRR